MAAFTYILECADGSYYTGWTNDIEKRLKAHNSGRGAKYTRGRTPVVLRYLEESADRSLAEQREAAIKKLPRPQKEELIRDYMERLAVPSPCGDVRSVMTDVYVKMTGRRKDTDGEIEEIVAECSAKAATRGGKHYIRYADELLVEGASVPTTLKIAEGALTVLRSGAVDAAFHYAEGHRQEALYKTPLGDFPMRHDTKSIAIDYDGTEGTVEVVYDVYFGSELQGENVLRIEVKRRT
ncbi:hypothetical protein TAMA11512_06110 [Selenomonas sp. TAMA-11512]|uniref:DUF1934 family protein n=1 Tax=Selenomonas sp. TAMA-11512 TaxID=3095337 RepID=UPI0030913082|nr:hypothetical protein TAMA11512_06110 [Selenomonas sp. TAMA-11512]